VRRRVSGWTGRGDDHVRVRREGLGGERGLGGRMAHHGQVELVAGEALQELLAIADAQMQSDARMPVAEGGDDPGEEVIAGIDHGDVEDALLERGEPADGFLGAADVLEDAARAGEHLHAGLRELEAAARALEELGARVALELAHLDRHGGGREVQLLGGAREGEVARGALEHAQLAEGGILH